MVEYIIIAFIAASLAAIAVFMRRKEKWIYMDKGRLHIPYINFALGNEIQMIADARGFRVYGSK